MVHLTFDGEGEEILSGTVRSIAELVETRVHLVRRRLQRNGDLVALSVGIGQFESQDLVGVVLHLEKNILDGLGEHRVHRLISFQSKSHSIAGHLSIAVQLITGVRSEITLGHSVARRIVEETIPSETGALRIPGELRAGLRKAVDALSGREGTAASDDDDDDDDDDEKGENRDAFPCHRTRTTQ